MRKSISSADLAVREAGGASVKRPLVKRAPDPKIEQDREKKAKTASGDKRHGELVGALKSNGEDVSKLAEGISKSVEASNTMAQSLSQGNAQIVELLGAMIQQNMKQADEPVPYRLRVNRDENRLISTIDMFPLYEDE